MHTLGVRPVALFRNSKSRPWMLRPWRTLPGHPHGRRPEPDLGAVVAPERRGEAALADLDAVQLLEEVDVEEGAPELAVGDAAQADLLLAAHHVPDRRVLDRAQGRAIDLAAGAARARLEQALRPQKAADVVGPIRWRGAVQGLASRRMRASRPRATLPDPDAR